MFKHKINNLKNCIDSLRWKIYYYDAEIISSIMLGILILIAVIA